MTIKKLEKYIKEIISQIQKTYPKLESHRNNDQFDYHRGELSALYAILETIRNNDL